MEIKCLQCGKIVKCYPSDHKKYCSRKCGWLGIRYLNNGRCKYCKKKLKHGRKMVYCDRTCHIAGLRRTARKKREKKEKRKERWRKYHK